MRGRDIRVGKLYRIWHNGRFAKGRVDLIRKQKRPRNKKEKYAPRTSHQLLWDVTDVDLNEHFTVGTPQRFLSCLSDEQELG